MTCLLATPVIILEIECVSVPQYIRERSTAVVPPLYVTKNDMRQTDHIPNENLLDTSEQETSTCSVLRRVVWAYSTNGQTGKMENELPYARQNDFYRYASSTDVRQIGQVGQTGHISFEFRQA